MGLKIYLGIGCIFTFICYLMCYYHVFSKAGLPGAEEVEDGFIKEPLAWISVVFVWLPGLLVGMTCAWREMK